MERTEFAVAPISRALQEVYLQRLRRLQRLRQLHEEELNRQGIRLLDRSLFAAYCDCRDIGAEEGARAILRGGGFDPDSPPRQPRFAGWSLPDAC